MKKKKIIITEFSTPREIFDAVMQHIAWTQHYKDEKKRLNIKEFCDAADMSRMTIYNYRNAATIPTACSIIKIIRAIKATGGSAEFHPI